MPDLDGWRDAEQVGKVAVYRKFKPPFSSRATESLGREAVDRAVFG
jgi:hypothetical protein